MSFGNFGGTINGARNNGKQAMNVLGNAAFDAGEVTPPPIPSIRQHDESGIVVPDDAPGASIYAFLNAVAAPYTGPLHPNIAGALEDIYPSGSQDPHGFYAALRANDPQRTRYRHLDLLASAAASAPSERITHQLARAWSTRGPVGLGDNAVDDQLTKLLVLAERWFRNWLALLNCSEWVPWDRDNDDADLAILSQLSAATDTIERLQCGELRLRERLRREDGGPHADDDVDGDSGSGSDSGSDSDSKSDSGSGPRPRRATVPTWFEQAMDEVVDAFRRVSQRFHDSSASQGSMSFPSGDDARLTAADAAYWALPAATRLVAQLLATEKLAERILARRHAEEMPLMRQVHFYDRESCAETEFALLYPVHEAATHYVEREVRHIQHVANRSAVYRYFKLNRIGRPWRRLHLVMGDNRRGSSSPSGNDNCNGNGSGTTCRDIDEETVRSVAEQLDAFADTPTQPLQVRPTLPSYFDDNHCSICLEAWAKDQLVLETRCGWKRGAPKGHFFHFQCIFRVWDVETASGFECSLCRQIDAPQPGARFGRETPHRPPTSYDLQRLRRGYWAVRRWQQQHPGQMLGYDQQCLRLDYYRHLLHNRDRRSIIGFGGRPYIWHPLPLEELYNEEGLPEWHPPYRYDVETDRLVVINPYDRQPALEEFPRLYPYP